MKITNIFSTLGLAFRSIFTNKRRSVSIGAGMILGAAIFSSIFFYGSMINSITVQDIIDNTEAEIAFSPPVLTKACPGKNCARCPATAMGPIPGPPPPCGILNVLCRFKWHTSAPMAPGLVRPTWAFILAPSI